MKLTTGSILRAFNLKQVGQCAACMQAAFLLMIFAWATYFASEYFGFSNNSLLLLAFAVSMSLLWIAHIVARAVQSTPTASIKINQRRFALQTFGKAMLGAFIVSTAITPWQKALADSGCGGWAGNSGCKKCGRCERQTANCDCYPCRSCGEGCSGNC